MRQLFYKAQIPHCKTIELCGSDEAQTLQAANLGFPSLIEFVTWGQVIYPFYVVLRFFMKMIIVAFSLGCGEYSMS
jgi:hypothetical protein